MSRSTTRLISALCCRTARTADPHDVRKSSRKSHTCSRWVADRGVNVEQRMSWHAQLEVGASSVKTILARLAARGWNNAKQRRSAANRRRERSRQPGSDMLLRSSSGSGHDFGCSPVNPRSSREPPLNQDRRGAVPGRTRWLPTPRLPVSPRNEGEIGRRRAPRFRDVPDSVAGIIPGGATRALVAALNEVG